MATPPRSGAIAIPFLLAGLTFGLFAFSLLSCSGGGAGPGALRSWSPAISLDNSSTNQFVPDVAVDGNGNAIVVWFQSNDNGISNVWASRYVSGHGWEPPAQIETEEAVASGCRVAMDPNGNAIVTWVQRDFRPGHGSNVWAALYRVGTGWDAPSFIGNDNAFTAENPRISMDGNGNALAVWEQLELLDSIISRTIWANRYTWGVGWGTLVRVGPNTGSSFSPDVAVDPMGNGIVVWAQQEDGANLMTGRRVWASRYVAGEGWENPSPIEESLAVAVGTPKVAMNAQGNATVVWGQSEVLTPPRVCSNRYEYGKGWGLSERTVSDNSWENYNPDVSIDSGGNAITVWSSPPWSQDTLWANRYGIGSGWGLPRSIGFDNNMIVFDARVGMDGAGNGIVAWTQSEFPTETVMANRFVPGSGWSTPVKIDTGDGVAMRRIRLAVSARGDAFAVWEQFEPSGATRIWATRYGAASR